MLKKTRKTPKPLQILFTFALLKDGSIRVQYEGSDPRTPVVGDAVLDLLEGK